MTIRSAIATIVFCTVLLASIGSGIGLTLGTFLPGYYRYVFRSGDESWFDPVSVGTGLGRTQGTIWGIVVGIVLVALFNRSKARVHRQLTVSPSTSGSDLDTGTASPVRRNLGSLFSWFSPGGEDRPSFLRWRDLLRLVVAVLTPWLLAVLSVVPAAVFRLLYDSGWHSQEAATFVTIWFYLLVLAAIISGTVLFFLGVWRLVWYRTYRRSVYGWAWLPLMWMSTSLLGSALH